MKISIAGINIELEDEIPYIYNAIKDFENDFKVTDLAIKILDVEIQYEIVDSNKSYKKNDLLFTAIQRKLSEMLSSYDAIVLHSACFDVDGVGVAFAAHSGTGKTTHMNLWQKLLGDKMVIVNGDKPIVRFFDDEPETPYAYGTPWNGKEGLGCNMRTKLKHICFIERSETNYTQKMDKNEVINRIFNQVYKPKDPIAVMKTMELIDRLLSCCNLWTIHCNMEDEAAEVAYNTIFGE